MLLAALAALSVSSGSVTLATCAPTPHVLRMECDFSVFRERLAEACHVRSTTPSRVAKVIGMSPRRIIDLEYSGTRALDIDRLGQIADHLDVSIDWLLGRSDVMDVAKATAKKSPDRGGTQRNLAVRTTTAKMS